MSVKKKDRHQSNSEVLEKIRRLVNYTLIITRPALADDAGKVTKPGILGYGQPYIAFGKDIFQCSKNIHSSCYQALKTKVKDQESLNKREQLFRQGVEYCDSIQRLVDLCIFIYGKSQKKRKSFQHLSLLTYEVRKSIFDRINKDNLIFQQSHKDKKQ